MFPPLKSCCSQKKEERCKFKYRIVIKNNPNFKNVGKFWKMYVKTKYSDLQIS